MDWSAVAGVGALLAVVVAITALVVELRSARVARQIELITRFDAVYRHSEFQRVRGKAAKVLLQEKLPANRDSSLDELLGFFEFLGHLKREKVLSDFQIWHLFATQMFYYVTAAQTYIAALNNRNKSVYEDLIRVHRAMIEVEKKEAGAGSPDLALKQEEIRSFLQSEETLLTENRAEALLPSSFDTANQADLGNGGSISSWSAGSTNVARS